MTRRRELVVIRPHASWRPLDAKKLWQYRELLFVLVERDLRVRYKQTLLGASWTILKPAVTAAVFTLIFGAMVGVPSDGHPYAIFVYAGLLPWSFFADAVSRAGNSLINSPHLVGKVYFPRLIIPLAAVGAAFFDLLVSLGVLLPIIWAFGSGFTLSILAAPALCLALAMAALGVGCMVSALTVSYRDFVHATPFALQLWMYLTPVIYPSRLLPAAWQWVAQWNPMWGLVAGFRSALLGGALEVASLGVSLVVSAAVAVAGMAYFHKVERRFADVI